MIAITIPLSTGSYSTALKAYVLSHTTHNDPVAPSGTGTSILVNFYYPTVSPAKLQTYIWTDLSSYYEEIYQVPAGTFANITARLALGDRPIPHSPSLELPTLLFGPPAAGPPSQLFFSLFSQLASHGYTVVTVHHPHEAPSLRYPNGTVYPGLPPDGGNVTGEAIYAYRLTDNTALLDALPTISQVLQVPINLSHFITFGHSLGGSAALEQVLVERSRPIHIIATLNLDEMNNGRVNSTHADLGVPALLLASSMHADDPDWRQFAEQQSKWSKIIRIDRKTNHTDYSDSIV